MQMCYGKSSSSQCKELSLPGLLTDLQLSLNASLAALPVVRLGGVVF